MLNNLGKSSVKFDIDLIKILFEFDRYIMNRCTRVSRFLLNSFDLFFAFTGNSDDGSLSFSPDRIFFRVWRKCEARRKLRR